MLSKVIEKKISLDGACGFNLDQACASGRATSLMSLENYLKSQLIEDFTEKIPEIKLQIIKSKITNIVRENNPWYEGDGNEIHYVSYSMSKLGELYPLWDSDAQAIELQSHWRFCEDKTIDKIVYDLKKYINSNEFFKDVIESLASNNLLPEIPHEEGEAWYNKSIESYNSDFITIDLSQVYLYTDYNCDKFNPNKEILKQIATLKKMSELGFLNKNPLEYLYKNQSLIKSIAEIGMGSSPYKIQTNILQINGLKNLLNELNEQGKLSNELQTFREKLCLIDQLKGLNYALKKVYKNYGEDNFVLQIKKIANDFIEKISLSEEDKQNLKNSIEFIKENDEFLSRLKDTYQSEKNSMVLLELILNFIKELFNCGLAEKFTKEIERYIELSHTSFIISSYQHDINGHGL